jgi:hypothetical protein
MLLSGTSMSAGVVSGVVATMLEASRAKHAGTVLTRTPSRRFFSTRPSTCLGPIF